MDWMKFRDDDHIWEKGGLKGWLLARMYGYGLYTNINFLIIIHIWVWCVKMLGKPLNPLAITNSSLLSVPRIGGIRDFLTHPTNCSYWIYPKSYLSYFMGYRSYLATVSPRIRLMNIAATCEDFFVYRSTRIVTNSHVHI